MLTSECSKAPICRKCKRRKLVINIHCKVADGKLCQRVGD